MTSQITRRTLTRSVLAGAVSVPALSALALNAAASADDPIFSVIEKHRAAFIRKMAACRLQSETSNNDPDHDEIERRADVLHALAERAGRRLSTVRPTTTAGIFALIQYVGDFNDGKVWLEETRTLEDKLDHWHSDPYDWPKYWWNDDCSDEINLFPYKVMENIHAALKSMATA